MVSRLFDLAFKISTNLITWAVTHLSVPKSSYFNMTLIDLFSTKDCEPKWLLADPTFHFLQTYFRGFLFIHAGHHTFRSLSQIGPFNRTGLAISSLTLTPRDGKSAGLSLPQQCFHTPTSSCSLTLFGTNCLPSFLESKKKDNRGFGET